MGILRKVEVVETDGANSQNPRYLLQTSQASQTDAIIIHLASVWIRFILMRIRIPGSASGIMDPTLNIFNIFNKNK